MIHINENKDKKNTNSLHDDFDELLHEFMQSSLSDDKEAPDNGNSQSFVYQNESYSFPTEKEQRSYCLNQLEVTSEHFMTNGKNLCQYYLLHDKLPGSIQMHLSRDGFPTDKDFLLQVLLYKVGNPNPIATCEVYPFLYSIPWDPVLSLDRSFEAGRYFLFFPGASLGVKQRGITELEEGLCYGFDLLQRYDRYRPFDMGFEDMLQVDWARKLTPNSWHLETLELKTGLCRDEEVPVEISAFCYTDDLIWVSQTTVCRKQLRSPVFQFKPKVPWMKGVYHVVFAVNSYPLAVVHFDIQDDGEINFVWHEDLKRNDLFFKLVHEMEYNHASMWENVSKVEGLGRDKRKLLHLYCSRQRAERAQHRRDSELMLIVSSCEDKAIELARAVEPILKLGREEIYYVDLENLEDGREHWETFKSDSERMNRTFVFSHSMSWMEKDGCLHAAMQRLFAAPHEGVTMVLCLSENDYAYLQVDYPLIFEEVGSYKHLKVGTPSLHEKGAEVLKAMRSSHLKITRPLECEVMHFLQTHWEEYALHTWTTMDKWLHQVVRKNVKARLDGNESFDIRRSKVQRQDLQLETFFQTDRRGISPARLPMMLDHAEFDAAMHELNGMVGLHSLKQELQALFNHLQFCRMRTSLGLPNLKEMPRHMIFTGNPGTGKTTVAKLIGRIYRCLGILSDGGTLVTQRSKLVGQYIGQTEVMMEQFLDSAKGKVVFIDEAYSLFTDSSDRRDVGYRVIESLLPVLSDPDSDMVFILAGYKREMDDLMKANAGLASRFPLNYEFKDYTADELLQMVVGRLNEGKYVLTGAALTALKEYIDHAVAEKDENFGNGRWARQLVDGQILPALAERVMKSDQAVSVELFSRVEETDIRSLSPVVPRKRPVRKAIGFC